MLPDQVSNLGPLTYESGALPIALRGPATYMYKWADSRLYFGFLCGNGIASALCVHKLHM